MNNAQALIVEDNILNSEVLRTLLGTHGLESIIISSPREIVSVAAQVPNLRIVFLDLEFPNASGFETNRELIKMGWNPHIPIVAYSVHTSEIDTARREGFHSFIGKPINPDQFAWQLAKILANKPVWSIQ